MDNKIKEIYGKGANVYEETMAKYWHIDRKSFIENLNLKSGQKILEAAVGTGLDLPHFPKGTYVIGIDITSEMLEEAKRKKSKANIQLKEMNICSMSFKDNYFDAAVSTFTLCVVENPKKALEEIVRVTKTNSKIAIFDYCKSRNPETIKWQELIHYHAQNIGFPKDVIVWNSLIDYDELIYKSGLPLKIEQYERFESENPFSTACRIILRNGK